MRALKTLIGKEVGIRLAQAYQRASYTEEGEVSNIEEVGQVLITTLKAVDEKFLYIGEAQIDTAINIDHVSMISADKDLISSWLGSIEDNELPALGDKESLN